MFTRTILQYATKPAQAMERALSYPPYWNILWAALFGITFLGTQVFIMDGGDWYTYPDFLVEILYKGPIVGILFCAGYGTVAFLFAKWFSGKGSWMETLTAYGWSTLVYSFRLLILPLQLLLFGEQFFRRITPGIDGSLFLTLTYIVLLFIDIAILIWYARTLIVSTNRVHFLQWWKSMLIHGLTLSIVWIISLQTFGMLFFPF